MTEFTTTATVRPEIFHRTLESFNKNLSAFNMSECTLYMNLDPVPVSTDYAITKMISIAEIYFRKVIVHKPLKASFPVAVKWCWEQPQGRYFFHLEDDWELMVPVHVPSMLKQLDDHPNQSCVNLRAYNWPEGESRICLSPCVMRTLHAKILADRLTTDYNPEKQLRPMSEDNPGGGKHVGFYSQQFPQQVILKDLGRDWMDRSGWRKQKPVFFTQWEKA